MVIVAESVPVTVTVTVIVMESVGNSDRERGKYRDNQRQ